MLPSYLLSLREGIEAALIIGIVLGALGKIRRPDLKPAVWWGTVSAVTVSLLGAVFLTRFGLEMEGTAERSTKASRCCWLRNPHRMIF
jgi:high-affinity iron transporter